MLEATAVGIAEGIHHSPEENPLSWVGVWSLSAETYTLLNRNRHTHRALNKRSKKVRVDMVKRRSKLNGTKRNFEDEPAWRKCCFRRFECTSAQWLLYMDHSGWRFCRFRIRQIFRFEGRTLVRVHGFFPVVSGFSNVFIGTLFTLHSASQMLRF